MRRDKERRGGREDGDLASPWPGRIGPKMNINEQKGKRGKSYPRHLVPLRAALHAEEPGEPGLHGVQRPGGVNLLRVHGQGGV